MGQFLIDTNIVSSYLSSVLPEKGMQYIDGIINDTPNLSIISQIELLCWNITDPVKATYIQNFIDDSHIYDITPDVISNCVLIRKGKKIKTPDAIIAATALAHGFVLVTNNVKDFANIKGLKIVNPALL